MKILFIGGGSLFAYMLTLRIAVCLCVIEGEIDLGTLSYLSRSNSNVEVSSATPKKYSLLQSKSNRKKSDWVR